MFCCLILYDFFDTGSMRTAKNEDGKTYYVPADMTYREWEKQFIVQKPKGLLKRNKKNDKITNNGCLSSGDLVGFCKRHYMYGLEFIGNSGQNNSIIIKTPYCKVDEYRDYINIKIKEFFSNNLNLDVEKDYYSIIDFSNEI